MIFTDLFVIFMKEHQEKQCKQQNLISIMTVDYEIQ